MQQNDALVEKLRKILARTEEAGCTPEEAESAMKLASRLMAEHNLSLEEIQRSGSPDAEPMVEVEARDMGLRMLLEHTLAGAICKKHFYVATFFVHKYDPARNRGTKRMMMMGTAANVETARFVFNSLVSAFDRTFASYRARSGCPITEKGGFILGVYEGFLAKLDDEKRIMEVERDLDGKPGTGIVLASVAAKAMAAYREKYPNHKSKTSRPVFSTQSARDAGYAQGRALNINRGLGGSGTKAIGKK